MTRITVDLITDLDLNGETAVDAATRIQRELENAIGNGLLTGETAAEVEQYSLAVTISPENQEASIADFFANQIKDGNLDPENMPRHLARYGLMQPADFISVMHERGANTSRTD